MRTHLEVFEVLEGDVGQGLEGRLVVLLDGRAGAATVLESLEPEALNALGGALCKIKNNATEQKDGHSWA